MSVRSERLEIRVSPELLARVDELRGHEPRSSFIRRAVEATVVGPSVQPEPRPRKRPAPMREPEPVEGTPLPKIAPRHWQ